MMRQSPKSYETGMANGLIFGQVLRCMPPLQLFYSAADAAVVGRWAKRAVI